MVLQAISRVRERTLTIAECLVGFAAMRGAQAPFHGICAHPLEVVLHAP